VYLAILRIISSESTRKDSHKDPGSHVDKVTCLRKVTLIYWPTCRVGGMCFVRVLDACVFATRLLPAISSASDGDACFSGISLVRVFLVPDRSTSRRRAAGDFTLETSRSCNPELQLECQFANSGYHRVVCIPRPQFPKFEFLVILILVLELYIHIYVYKIVKNYQRE